MSSRSEHHARRPKRAANPPRPPAFGLEGPDGEYVERARSYLAAADERALMPLTHAFENRQDALLLDLEGQALSDEAFLCARRLCFELFAMIELGWPVESGRVVAEPPQALSAYCERVLFEAGLQGAEPLRSIVAQGLAVLWESRHRRK